MQQKQTFKSIFIVFIVILLILPFWNLILDLFTKLIMNIGWYRQIQVWIVPYEMRTVGSIFDLLNIPVSTGSSYFSFTDKKGISQALYLIWNCVGWQTFLMFAVTAISGFAGSYKNSSRIEALVLGLLGTYLINITRIFLVVLFYYQFGREGGIIFHDYFSGILTFSWLIFYWIFSFKYVLISKNTIS